MMEIINTMPYAIDRCAGQTDAPGAERRAVLGQVDVGVVPIERVEAPPRRRLVPALDLGRQLGHVPRTLLGLLGGERRFEITETH